MDSDAKKRYLRKMISGYGSKDVSNIVKLVSKNTFKKKCKSESTKKEFFTDVKRITDLLWEHTLESRTHLMPYMTAGEMYTIAKTILGTINLDAIRKPIMITEQKPKEITLGNAFRVLLHKCYEPDSFVSMTDVVSREHKAKMKGLLKDGDYVELRSLLPGGVANYKVSLVDSKDYEFAESYDSFCTKDMLLKMSLKDAKKIFGDTDGKGVSLKKLANDNDIGMFCYNIHRVLDPADARIRLSKVYDLDGR